MRKLLFILALLVIGGSACALADAAAAGIGDGVIPAPESAFPAGAAVFTSVGQQFGAQAVDVRLWVEGDQDLFQRGDRLRVQFRTSRDAYVAILHISPEGELDFIFPYGPRDNSFVRGQRTHSLPGSEWRSGWRVGNHSGMGYFFVVASAEPLDFRPFQFGSRWDLANVGSHVRGDPFWLLEQVTMLLVPGWRHTAYAVDHYSYHVGRRSPYPAFVCHDGPGWRDRYGWNAYYGSCDRIVLLLRSHPHYYDSRRYRGDRRGYWQQLEAPQPRHGFKERVDLPPQRPVPTQLRDQPGARPQPTTARPQPASPPVEQERSRERRAEPVRTERQRPTLERRRPEESQSPAPQPERTRERPPERARERPSQPAPERARERPAQPAPERQAPPPERRPRRDPPPQQQEGSGDPSAVQYSYSFRSAAPILRRPGE